MLSRCPSIWEVPGYQAVVAPSVMENNGANYSISIPSLLIFGPLTGLDVLKLLLCGP